MTSSKVLLDVRTFPPFMKSKSLAAAETYSEQPSLSNIFKERKKKNDSSIEITPETARWTELEARLLLFSTHPEGEKSYSTSANLLYNLVWTLTVWTT